MVDLIIKNGNVVLPDRTVEAAIAIDKGKIVAIGSATTMPKGEKVIDAKGKYVFSGGIDTHDHTRTGNDFVGSKGQAWGGTTTAINFARGGVKGVKERITAMSPSVIDYTLHATIGNVTPEKTQILDEIKEIIGLGIPSFKLFMVYADPTDDNTVLKVFEECKTYGGILCLHAENNSMIEYNRVVAVKKGNIDAIYHALTRPPITEAEAVNMAIYLASYLKTPYMNMHLSIKEGVELLREARKKGAFVYGETCTHYLSRTEEDLKGPRGIYYICTPPLRTKEHIDALWEGLRDGSVSIVGSDHAPSTTASKKGKASFADVPNGVPGHEFRLPVLFSEGVMKGRISVNRLSEVFSTNAAKIYGLYPKKGIISVGSDADLVVLDPKLEKAVTQEELDRLSIAESDWSPYEGMKVKGWPTATVSKGKVVWEGGIFQGKQGDGEFLKAKLPPELFKGLVV